MTKTVIAVLIGVLPPLIVAAVLSSSKSARRAIVALWHRTRPDHRALHQPPAWGLGHVGTTGLFSVRFIAAVAPSRSLRRLELDPEAAIRLVRNRFPGIFPDQPAFSAPRHGVRFDVGAYTSRSGGYAWVWASGRIDLCINVEPIPTPDGRVVLSILDLLRPIAMLAEAAASPEYTQVFGRPRLPFRKRFDWFIGVSGDLTRPDHSVASWDDLAFPGRHPQRAGTTQHPFCPPTGFAKDRLTSWDSRRPVAELLAAFLDDFLKTNGYHDVVDAIADTLHTFSETDTASAPKRRSLRIALITAAGLLPFLVAAVAIILLSPHPGHVSTTGRLSAKSSGKPTAGMSVPSVSGTRHPSSALDNICQPTTIGRGGRIIPNGPIMMSRSPARIFTASGSVVQVTGLCLFGYIPIANTRYVDTQLLLTNGVSIYFDDMKSFEVTSVKPMTLKSAEVINVTIVMKNGRVEKGRASPDFYYLGGITTFGAEFQLFLDKIRHVEFT